MLAAMDATKRVRDDNGDNVRAPYLVTVYPLVHGHHLCPLQTPLPTISTSNPITIEAVIEFQNDSFQGKD